MAWFGRLLVLIGLLALVACQTDTGGTTLAPVGEDLATLEKTRCEARGGTWGKVPRSEAFVCYRQTRDANRYCERSTQCQGVCLARSRTCSPVQPYFGCHEILSDNGVPSMVCTN